MLFKLCQNLNGRETSPSEKISFQIKMIFKESDDSRSIRIVESDDGEVSSDTSRDLSEDTAWSSSSVCRFGTSGGSQPRGIQVVRSL